LRAPLPPRIDDLLRAARNCNLGNTHWLNVAVPFAKGWVEPAPFFAPVCGHACGCHRIFFLFFFPCPILHWSAPLNPVWGPLHCRSTGCFTCSCLFATQSLLLSCESLAAGEIVDPMRCIIGAGLTILFLAAMSLCAYGTTKGLSQIVTPELQDEGDLSLS